MEKGRGLTFGKEGEKLRRLKFPRPNFINMESSAKKGRGLRFEKESANSRKE